MKKNFIDSLRMAILNYTFMYFDNREIENILNEMLASGFYFSYDDILERSFERVIVDFINYGIIENTDQTLIRNLKRKMK